MQPTDSHTLDSDNESRGRWPIGIQETVGVAALGLWVAVGGYAWFRATLAPQYTVGLVGAAVCLALVASLAEDEQKKSRLDRLLIVGCLLAVGVGTVGVWGSVEQGAASDPNLSWTALAAGALVVAGLLGVFARHAPLAAGLAVAAVVGAAASAPGEPVVETMVVGGGLYGPLTQAAVTWIAPLCLLVGLWWATGVDRQLAAIAGRIEPTAGATGRPFAHHQQQLAAVSCIAVLGWWQTGSLAAVGGLAAIGTGILAVAVGINERRLPDRRALTARLDSTDWREPLLVVGGPLAVMALAGGGYRLPVGTVLVAGCLCCLGCCVGRPAVTGGNRLRGVREAVAGSLVGIRLLARVVVSVAIAGSVVAVLDATGVSLRLLSGVVWLSAGYWVVAVVVVGCGCLLVGRVAPIVAAYAVGALLGVPMVELVTPLSEPTAHLVVAAAVVVGSLVSVDPPKL